MRPSRDPSATLSGDPWAALDATAQAELVARAEATPAELVAAAIARIERTDPFLGAVPVRSFEEAARQARELELGGELAGVPFLMKDVGARQAGHPYYAGNRALRDADHRAQEDTPLGARFRELGFVTLGSSNAPEFGLQSNTWPLAHGPTRNPWDPSRAAGGSSGGACAAVAAGLVPAAHASDGAGSIRIPAAWCGLIGFKPGRDRIVWRHAGSQRSDVEFVVARSLRDTATLLDLLRPLEARRAGPDRYRTALRRAGSDAGLHVGFTTRCPAGVPVDPDIARAVEATAQALADLGHAVAPAAPDALFEYEERALYGAVLGPLEYRACLDELESRLGRPVDSSDVEPFLWQLARHGHVSADDEEIARSAEWVARWTRRVLGWFESFDLLVTPTVHEPAPSLSALSPLRLAPLDLLERMVPHMAFTEPWNATGQPAISLPLAQTSGGLPVGVQLVAAPEREDTLICVSARLLEAFGRPAGRPRIHA